MLTFLQFPKAASLLFFLLFFTVQTKAQTIDLDIDIEDAFLKEPVIGVDVAVYTTDSVLVTDTVHTFSFRDRFNRLQREVYELRLKPEKRLSYPCLTVGIYRGMETHISHKSASRINRGKVGDAQRPERRP